MKTLFFICLLFLGFLRCFDCKAQSVQSSEEVRPELNDLFVAIANSHIPNKIAFKENLLNAAAEAKICPRLLFSLGLDQWDTLPEKDSVNQLKILASSAKFLK